jgi:hypothetical protein
VITISEFNTQEINHSLNDSERCLLRLGDILNTIGLFRAIMINNGNLDKKSYIKLVCNNYHIQSSDIIPVHISNKIDDVWDNSKIFFEDLNIIKKFNKDSIEISDPMVNFFL